MDDKKIKGLVSAKELMDGLIKKLSKQEIEKRKREEDKKHTVKMQGESWHMGQKFRNTMRDE